jgi:hypothetical protein
MRLMFQVDVQSRVGPFVLFQTAIYSLAKSVLTDVSETLSKQLSTVSANYSVFVAATGNSAVLIPCSSFGAQGDAQGGFQLSVLRIPLVGGADEFAAWGEPSPPRFAPGGNGKGGIKGWIFYHFVSIQKP